MQRLWVRALTVVLLLGALGYGLYAFATDSGVYRWLTERQTAWFGGHYPQLTMLAILVGGVVAALLLASVAERLAGPDPRGRATPVDARVGTTIVLVAGVGLLATAIALGWIASDRSAKPVVYAPFDLDRRELPRGPHVELTGVEQARWQLSITQDTTVTRFTPFTAADWTPDQPVTYFLKDGAASPSPVPLTFGAHPAHAASVSRRGALIEDGLPSVARAGFESHGLKLASAVFVVDSGAGAAVLRFVIAAVICGVIALCCLLGFVLERVTARRRR
jgi:hypothetical protein